MTQKILSNYFNTATQEVEEEYVPFHFNARIITGYYITRDNLKDDSINVTVQGGATAITFKRTPEFYKYLQARFL